MRLNIVKIEAEGTAAEFAEAIPAMLTPTISQVPAAGANTLTGPVPELTGGERPSYALEATEAIDQPSRTERSAPSDGGAEIPSVTVEETAEGRAGRPAASHPATPPVVLDEKPRDWDDIPAELRVWNAIGTCCHIAKHPNDLYETWCGHDAGKVRAGDMEPRTQAEPCGNCLRRMREAARP